MATGLFTLKQVNQAISQGAWSGYIAPKWVEYLVVAGGGGGANGGAGGGGLLTGIVTVATGTSYTVTVGAGGSTSPTSGSNSVFGSLSATGGGNGGYGSPGGTGGSGGGAYSATGVLGQGTAGQGNAGGTGNTTAGGGGGGAGTVGLNAVATIGGNGGAGIASAITGTVVTYAGGGGGGASATGGAGGVGGGGTGSTGTGTAGGGNTGGGGGSGYGSGGGAGGSGIVVVRYPGNVQFYTGGTVTYSNGYIVHNFTASGTLAPTTPTVVSEYQISRSLRFNSADTTYLNRTPASAGNRTTWTYSTWLKLTSLANEGHILDAGNDQFVFYTAGNITLFDGSNTSLEVIKTTQVFRDFSAWYHVVLVWDTTQATASNRVKLYINGSQVTAFATTNYPAQNATLAINNNVQQRIGAYTGAGNFYFNGYMTEVNFIDGQALTPTSFGYVNPTTGIWSPAKFVGGYGTNGFYLNFSDNSNTTAATLGKDYSGNGNNWTPNNFSVTAGAGNDSLVDSPTSYGTDTGVGGTVRGNYCTLNPIALGSATLTNGNLDASVGGDANGAYGTIGVNSGKWYWEVLYVSGTNAMIGIANTITGTGAWVNAFGWAYYEDGAKYTNNTRSAGYGASYAANAIIGVALDMDAGTLTFYKNGTSQGVAYSSLSGTMTPYLGNGGGSTAYTINLGQRPFAYTAPSGFKALCTQNLPTPTIGATTATQAGKFFNPVLYTGNGSNSRSVTGVGFQPDFVWMKARSQAYVHGLANAVTGVNKFLISNSTGAELTNDAYGYLSSFDSDGFSLTGGTSGNDTFNRNTDSFVAWNWKANGAGSSNTSGSITSTVSANTTSGFSVVTYTGNATSNQTFGHGLGAKVDLAIIKSRSAVSSPAWMVWHRSVCSGNGKALALEETNAIQGPFGTPMWDSSNTSTQSSTTTFTIGANTTINASGATYVAYCFAEVAGYSKIGSYIGNGVADGPFIYCGFRPAFVMFKNASSTGAWGMYDRLRAVTYNPQNAVLYPNYSNAENIDPSYTYIDFVSNGIKIRSTGADFNYISGNTYIFMAFAENPFKTSLAR